MPRRKTAPARKPAPRAATKPAPTAQKRKLKRLTAKETKERDDLVIALFMEHPTWGRGRVNAEMVRLTGAARQRGQVSKLKVEALDRLRRHEEPPVTIITPAAPASSPTAPGATPTVAPHCRRMLFEFRPGEAPSKLAERLVAELVRSGCAPELTVEANDDEWIVVKATADEP